MKATLIVIENDAELARTAIELNPTIHVSEVIIEGDWLKLAEHARFRDAVCRPYRSVIHAPSLQIEPMYFGSVERLLRGRDKLGFLVLLKTRPELLSSLLPEAIAKISDDEAVSIKTMRELFSPQAGSSRDRRIWRVLEELVL